MSNMFLNIVSTFKGDGIKQATGQLGAFGGKLGGFGSILGKTATALAAFGVVSKSIEFGREAITSARDLERNLYGVEKIFGDLAPQMVEFTKNAVDMGLSQSKAAKATTFIGSVLKQSGFEMADVAVETQKLVGLATDLSALYGYDVQEALLGMTALFRGEYDPIEKFGVAMKQNEINAELAARGQNNLTGAARRNAEQVIRMELLYDRASDALGTFAEQSGTLFVEQKKLGATFENFQASLGSAVIPAVADLNTALRETLEDITPAMTVVFGFFAEVMTGVVNIIRDATDPTSDLGESFWALGKRLESLFKLIFGSEADLGDFFDLVSAGLGMFLDLMHDLLLFVENGIDLFGILGEQISLLFSGSVQGMKKLFTTDWNQKILDAFAENAAASVYSKEAAEDYAKSLEGLFGGKGTPFDDAVATTTGSGKAAEKPEGPTGIFAWLAKAEQEAQIAQKRIQLIAGGLSEAVVDSILSATDPLGTANDALFLIATGGLVHINAMTEAFKNSAAGQALVAQQAAKAAEEAAEIAEQARQREQEILDKRKEALESFSSSVKDIFGGIKDSIMSAFSLPDLGNSVNSITRNIKKLIERTKAFAANITSLSQQGLGNELLQQIIAAGPMAGGRLAQALAGAGGGTISELNQAYGEFGSIASDIAGVGTRSAFGNAQVVNTYNIEVNGGVGSGPTIGKAIVDAIKSYERTSGAVWQGAA
jgi:hypothetical protein